jgi:hypothetical protein
MFFPPNLHPKNGQVGCKNKDIQLSEEVQL